MDAGAARMIVRPALRMIGALAERAGTIRVADSAAPGVVSAGTMYAYKYPSQEVRAFYHFTRAVDVENTWHLLASLQVGSTRRDTGALTILGSCYLMETDWDPATLCWNNQPTLVGSNRVQYQAAGTVTSALSSDASLVWPVDRRIYGLAVVCETTGSLDPGAEITVGIWLDDVDGVG